MRSKSFIAICAFLVVLLVAAGAVYAYDTRREERIAKGVKVNGVDVGGLDAAAARRKLELALLQPLNEPVFVSARGKRFTLNPEKAGVTVDIDASVASAVARSRRGNVLSRTVRELTGGTVRAEVPVTVRYDDGAVDRLVRRVRKTVERKPVDADVDLENGDVTPQPSQDGLRVRANRLRRDIATALTSFSGERTVRARVSRVKPKVTTDEIADQYPAIVIVDRNAFKLTLYKNLKPAKTYRIAVGQAGLETPAGLYHVQNKAENPAWHVPDSDWAGDLAGQVIPPGPENPIKARWMGIYDGAGIHGTDAVGSLGTAASHGCIRMAVPDVIELYDKVPTGAPVYIA